MLLSALQYIKSETELISLITAIIIFIICMSVPFVLSMFTPYRIKFRRGVKALKRKEYEKAVNIFTKCIKKKPESSYPYCNRAIAYLSLKMFDNAINDAQTAAKYYPYTFHPYYIKYIVYAQLKNFDLMEENADKALEFRLNKKIRALHLYHKAAAHIEKKEFVKANAILHDVIKYNKKMSEAYNDLGYTCTFLNLYNEAIDYLDTAIKLKPDSAFAFNNRGFVFALLGNFDKSFEDYRTSLSLNPENGYLFKNRGVTYLMNKKYDEACKDLEKAIKLEPQFEEELFPKIEECKNHLNPIS